MNSSPLFDAAAPRPNTSPSPVSRRNSTAPGFLVSSLPNGKPPVAARWKNAVVAINRRRSTSTTGEDFLKTMDTNSRHSRQVVHLQPLDFSDDKLSSLLRASHDRQRSKWVRRLRNSKPEIQALVNSSKTPEKKNRGLHTDASKRCHSAPVKIRTRRPSATEAMPQYSDVPERWKHCWGQGSAFCSICSEPALQTSAVSCKYCPNVVHIGCVQDDHQSTQRIMDNWNTTKDRAIQERRDSFSVRFKKFDEREIRSFGICKEANFRDCLIETTDEGDDQNGRSILRNVYCGEWFCSFCAQDIAESSLCRLNSIVQHHEKQARDAAAMSIQKIARMANFRRRYCKMKKSTISVQSVFRYQQGRRAWDKEFRMKKRVYKIHVHGASNLAPHTRPSSGSSSRGQSMLGRDRRLSEYRHRFYVIVAVLDNAENGRQLCSFETKTASTVRFSKGALWCEWDASFVIPGADGNIALAFTLVDWEESVSIFMGQAILPFAKTSLWHRKQTLEMQVGEEEFCPRDPSRQKIRLGRKANQKLCASLHVTVAPGGNSKSACGSIEEKRPGAPNKRWWGVLINDFLYLYRSNMDSRPSKSIDLRKLRSIRIGKPQEKTSKVDTHNVKKSKSNSQAVQSKRLRLMEIAFLDNEMKSQNFICSHVPTLSILASIGLADGTLHVNNYNRKLSAFAGFVKPSDKKLLVNAQNRRVNCVE